MNETRYIHKSVPISKEDAEKQRQQEVEYIKNQISDLLMEMEALCKSPLPTTCRVRVALNPGDKGYEDAPFTLDLSAYQGDITWKYIENSTPPKPE